MNPNHMLEQALALWPPTDPDAPQDPDAYEVYLRDKIGEYAFREISDAHERCLMTDSDEGLTALFDVRYKHDAYWLLDAAQPERGRQTFHSLLARLPDIPLAIVDFGSGDGRVDIALAMMRKDIRISAVESSREGLKLMERLTPDTVKGRITSVNQDFRHYNKPADVVILSSPAYPPEWIAHATTIAPRVLCTFDGYGQATYEIGTYFGNIACHYGFSITNMERRKVSEHSDIVTLDMIRPTL